MTELPPDTPPELVVPYEQESPLRGVPDGRMYLAIVTHKGHIVHLVERSELALQVCDKLKVHHGFGARLKNRRLQRAANEAITDFFLAMMRL